MFTEMPRGLALEVHSEPFLCECGRLLAADQPTFIRAVKRSSVWDNYFPLSGGICCACALQAFTKIVVFLTKEADANIRASQADSKDEELLDMFDLGAAAIQSTIEKISLFAQQVYAYPADYLADACAPEEDDEEEEVLDEEAV